MVAKLDHLLKFKKMLVNAKIVNFLLILFCEGVKIQENIFLGHGVIVNTSFNIRGEPIVCSPKDAYRCFMATEMDILVLEDHILYKTEQPLTNRISKDSHISQFKLD